jgi:hypothetical protein
LRCPIKDRQGERAWANIDPFSWSLVVDIHNNEVGVFEKGIEDSGDLSFLHGRVYLTVKYMVNGKANWTELYCRSGEIVGHLAIDRPKTFDVSDSL